MKLLIPIIIFLCSSCDCAQTAKGFVKDLDTNLPIGKVEIVNIVSLEKEGFTKEDGSFDVFEISGGLSKCPPLNLVFSKEGYNSDTILFDVSTPKIIFLNKKK